MNYSYDQINHKNILYNLNKYNMDKNEPVGQGMWWMGKNAIWVGKCLCFLIMKLNIINVIFLVFKKFVIKRKNSKGFITS